MSPSTISNGGNSAPETAAHRSPLDDKRRALAQVLSSKTFGRSDQLKRFLRYICETELEGHGDSINEYSIAVQALGHPASYSPGDDSAVRSRAYALRQKLHDFYASEGRDARVRIDLPKGSYRPNFVEWTEPLPVPLKQALPILTPARRASTTHIFLAGVLTAVGLASVVFVLFALPRMRANAMDPAIREVWGSLVQPGGDVTIYVGCPPAVMFRSFREGEVPSNRNLMAAPPAIADWYGKLRMLDGGGQPYLLPNRAFALLGDAFALATAARVLSEAGTSFQVLPELDTPPAAVQDRDVIMIASPNYSQYVAHILKDAAFNIRYDPGKRDEIIVDQTSGKPLFAVTPDRYGAHDEVYALITVLPSFVTANSSKRTVVFSGISTYGTQAAMEYFASPASLRDLLDRFRHDGYAKVPKAYQVVVRYSLNRVLPPKWAYAAHAVMKTLPSNQ